MTKEPRPDGAEPALREKLAELIEQWKKASADYQFYGQPFHPRAQVFDGCATELEAVLASSQRAEKETS